MRKWRWFLLIVLTVMVFFSPGISEAAHFSLTGTSSLSGSGDLTLTQYQWCNFDYARVNQDTTIDPNGSENTGDPVTINYCYTATGSTTTPGSPYVAIAGIGDSSSFDVACLPQPPAYTAPSNPATFILNPGPAQTAIISYPPQVLTGNETVSVLNQCGTFQAHIGDTLQIDAGVFALLYDTRGFPAGDAGQGVTASISFTFDANIISSTPSVSVPTLNPWGGVVLAVVLGIGPVYYLRRRRSPI
jgi:hypothetical protein